MSQEAHAVALRWRMAWLGIGWTLVGLVILLSLLPLAGGAPFSWFDKLEHAGAYFLLMWWFAALTVARRRPWVALGAILLGGAVEVAQGFTGWRAAEFQDLLADALGVGAGWWFATLTGPRPFRVIEHAVARAQR